MREEASRGSLPPPWQLADGIVVRAPERPEPGFWAGCPSVIHRDGRFWLTYRERRPRGTGNDRGWRCAIAVSDDGIAFDDVWEVTKDALDSASMERFCLADHDGRLRLFLSFVDPVDGRWRIDAIDADDPAAFDVSTRRPMLAAASSGTEGVKDPVVVDTADGVRLLVSFAAARLGLPATAHATADIYNVGATIHPTGLAVVGPDGTAEWQGEALGVGPGWDRYQARLGAVVPVRGGWLGWYDGSASHHENYQERCGLAVSPDLRDWWRLTVEVPWLSGPEPSRSVRYVSIAVVEDRWWVYAEVTRPDGAHELRVLPGVAPLAFDLE